MFELGPHASFIVAAYGVTVIALAGLVLATVGDDLKQRRLLAALERQGIRRRSAAKPAAKSAAKSPAKAKTPRTAAKKPAAKAKTKTKPTRPAKRKTPS
jgi:heme exporter protein D